MSKMKTSSLLLLGAVLLSLASFVFAQEEGWTDYTDEMVSGTVTGEARESGPLPEGCPLPEVKDHYVIGFAQANSAEPWRTAMNDQL